ncbi:LysR family transcriptional regulator [Shinella sp. BYT-45]|uniref:LysR family transcriptional regulator n=1 Tax=Shinella sp. BYT-45 TaxID=3377377 RepID=UPI00398092F2
MPMTERDRLSLKQARAIDAVAKTRGFEQAARLMNVSQPVVSRLIGSAEALVGMPLFQRGWSGTELTALGEGILGHCSAALDLIARAEDDIAAMSGIRPNLRNFIRWHHLDAVTAVVRHGSASAASAHLNMTQPAITRSITGISDYSRQLLFHRRRSGLEATAPARRLAVLRDELLQALGTVEDFRRNVRPGLIGRLAVGMLPFSGQNLVAKTFGNLTNRFPDLRLMAVPGSYGMLAEALRRGEIECMIGVLRDPPPFSDLEEIFLYNEKFTLIARRDHPCHGRRRTISELKNETWIVAPHGTPVRAYFEQLFRNAGDRPPAQTCEILSFANAEEMIMNSKSIGLLSYSDERIADLPPDLRKVDVDLPGNEVAIGLTVRKTGGSVEILREFETLLRQNCP